MVSSTRQLDILSNIFFSNATRQNLETYLASSRRVDRLHYFQHNALRDLQMADESSSALQEIAGLLRRQVEQTDEQVAREKIRAAKVESQQVRLSRILALV